MFSNVCVFSLGFFFQCDKFIGISVKTFISLVSFSLPDCKLIFESRKEYAGDGRYFNISSKMDKNEKFAYINAS